MSPAQTSNQTSVPSGAHSTPRSRASAATIRTPHPRACAISCCGSKPDPRSRTETWTRSRAVIVTSIGEPVRGLPCDAAFVATSAIKSAARWNRTSVRRSQRTSPRNHRASAPASGPARSWRHHGRHALGKDSRERPALRARSDRPDTWAPGVPGKHGSAGDPPGVRRPTSTVHPTDGRGTPPNDLRAGAEGGARPSQRSGRGRAPPSVFLVRHEDVRPMTGARSPTTSAPGVGLEPTTYGLTVRRSAS
jgi:hypothetical protein